MFSLFFLPCSHLLLVQVLFSCLLLSSIQQTVSDNYPPFSPINLAFSSLSIHAKAWSSLRFTFEPQTVHATFYTVLLPPHLHFCYQQHLVVPVQVHPQAEERQGVGSVSLNSSIMSTLETVFFFSCPLGSDSQALGDAEAPVVTTTTPLNVDPAFGDVIYQETTGGVVYDFLQVHVKEPLLRRML